MLPSVQMRREKSYAPSFNDVIYRCHLKLGTSGIVTPRLQLNNEVPASLKQRLNLKPQRGKYRISPRHKDSESAPSALNNGWIRSHLETFYLYPFLAKHVLYFHR